MSYRNLDIWKLARGLSVEVHHLTLNELPRFELHEEGSQLRRSAKLIRSNIVEGYGRGRYKQDFIRFLTFAHASCDETIDHMEVLWETGSLKDSQEHREILVRLDELGRKLNRFIRSVDDGHQT